MSTLLSAHSQPYAPGVEHLLFYKIMPAADGIRLRIWESASHLGDSSLPYIYILNLRVKTPAEAEMRLREHLSLNGGRLVTGQELPYKGQVKLMPHATWTGDEG
jgi:hypothetical protein